MIVVCDTSPLNYLIRGLINFERTIKRLEEETTFYVAENVLEEFRRRARERNHIQ
jgi:rRNA-processing protein FCF1